MKRETEGAEKCMETKEYLELARNINNKKIFFIFSSPPIYDKILQ